jgi:hypothetical protein
MCRNRALPILVLGMLHGLGCGDSSSPEKSDLGPPVILEHQFLLDSAAQLGSMRFVTQDPDGPVTITCGGAFEGEGEDRMVLSRPFAELRQHWYLGTSCSAMQGDTTVNAYARLEEKYPLDQPAVLTIGQPVGLRVGVPSSWSVRASDDWSLGEVWFAVAPEPDCTSRWVRMATLLGVGRTVIDTTLTATFDAAGPHCVAIGAVDDLDQGAAQVLDVLVSP